jgi:hypothetical protein
MEPATIAIALVIMATSAVLFYSVNKLSEV